ncbi:hypothetical protein A5772_13435 [Mycolicibacter sinensis]|uniref:Uncharacterized protein n=1 Tax=Mycolicibacter sinensis (strain JDM601) TaxID=875328 RepID=A0A1A2E6Z5_MYCSD|nr:hypothetical protein A5772_13435 [Mycolicibacter sinensis]OBG00887.1 hypothetical protein A5771_17600 [Mycolicibacter sinensis]
MSKSLRFFSVTFPLNRPSGLIAQSLLAAADLIEVHSVLQAETSARAVQKALAIAAASLW